MSPRDDPPDQDTPPERARHALETECARRHEAQTRARVADREYLLEKINTQAAEVKVLRDWRHEESNRMQERARAPWAQIVGFAFSLVALGGGIVAAWISSDQRLTRIEVRVESMTSAVEALTGAQREWLQESARRATEAASTTTRLDAIDARLRQVERRRPANP